MAAWLTALTGVPQARVVKSEQPELPEEIASLPQQQLRLQACLCSLRCLLGKRDAQHRLH